MYHSTIQADMTATIAVEAVIFTPLERAVVEIARGERGRGLLPATRFGALMGRMLHRLTGVRGVRPLADPRLEALRTFVNALHRRGRARADRATAALRAAGFSPLQESLLRSAASTFA